MEAACETMFDIEEIDWTCAHHELRSHACQDGVPAPSPAVPKIPRGTKRLGDIVFNIDCFRLVILGNLLQALLLFRISGRLGLTFGARGIVAKIISGGIDISCHGWATDERGIRSPHLIPEIHPETGRS
jgi:hypothetical protein